MSPWWILLIVVLFVGTNGGSYLYGGHVQLAEDKAAQKDEIVKAVADYDEIAQEDKATAVAAAQKRTAAANAASAIKGDGNAAITAHPLTLACNWDSLSFGLLNAAIDRANNKPATKPGVPAAVPEPGKAK